MIWQTLTTPTLCCACHREQAIGVEVVTYQLGTITRTMCRDCRTKADDAKAKQDGQKRAALSKLIPDDATPDQAASILQGRLLGGRHDLRR